jgi:hypothetical protein
MFGEGQSTLLIVAPQLQPSLPIMDTSSIQIDWLFCILGGRPMNWEQLIGLNTREH